MLSLAKKSSSYLQSNTFYIAISNSIAIPSWVYIILSSLFITVTYNLPIFYFLFNQLNAFEPSLQFKIVALSFMMNLILVSLFSFKRLLKGWLLILITISAFSSYFMMKYGILIDKDMLQNVVETDWNETQGLIGTGLFFHLVLFLFIPAMINKKMNIQWGGFGHQLKVWLTLLIITFILLAGFLQFNYKELSSFFRNHREVKHLAVPFNAISASISVGEKIVASAFPTEFQLVALNAKLTTPINKIKPNLFVMIVGETARADHFTLNGYHRNTTPKLLQLLDNTPDSMVNFSDVASCGTATAISVPCMFSYLNQASYDADIAKNSDNVLDILQRAGVDVTWLDNNSGCKGMCDRILTQNIINCDGEQCSDLELIPAFVRKVASIPPSKDAFIVMHQLGSHGPEYFKRSTVSQKKFFPECETNQLQKCSQQAIINAYDNSILATDELIAETIESLKTLESEYNVGLLYISDHGESLGENGVYLHGLPYRIAPEAQKHVPMLIWLSDSFKHENNFDWENTIANKDKSISHDLLFNLILELMNIKENR